MTDKIKSLRLSHIAMTGSTCLAYYFLGNISLDSLTVPTMTTSTLGFFIIAVVGVLVSEFLFKSSLKKIDKRKKMEDNFGVYQTACLIRWAILEGVAFIIFLFKPDLLLLGVPVILYMAFLHPTEDRIKQDLQRM